MRRPHFFILALASLAVWAGCAATQMGYEAEEAKFDDLYGTWHRVLPGLGGGSTPKGQLILRPDGTYDFIDYGEGHSRSSSGRFAVYQAVGQDSLYPWIELERGGAMEQRVFQFSGPDTLLLREGDSGYAVADSEVDLYVRAPVGQVPQKESYDEKPVPITRVEPKYPVFAREAGIQGKVVLHVLVDEDGRVQKVDVVQAVHGLTDAAVDAVKKWTFKPAVKNGLPVAGWVEVPMDFHF